MIPKCCCNPAACHYVDDAFTRANETPVAAPWVKLTGTDWNLASNVLDAVAAADYKHTTAFPGASGDSRTAVVDFKLSVDGAVEVQTGKTDASNYFAARLTYTAGSCAILTAFAYSGGVGGSCTPGPSITDCVQVWGLTTGVWYRLRVCLIPNNGSYGYSTYDQIIAVISFPNDATRLPISCQVSTDGPSVGTLSGLKSTMAAQFDNFKASYYRDSPSGQHRTCPWCHTGCTISQDDFTTDQPCMWDVRSGSYSVSGGLMTLTATSVIQHHIFHPDLRTTHKVTVDVQDNGIESKVYIGNGYAKLTYSAGLRTLTLYDNDSNVLDTAVQTVAVTSDSSLYMSLTLCYSRGLSCTVTGRGSDLCVDALVAETDFGYWASLGGSTGAVFDNFVFSKTYNADAPSDAACDDCQACPTTCNTCCTSPDPASRYIVDLGAGGWVSEPAACSCDSCAAAAGEFLVTAISECNWSYIDRNCDFDLCCDGCSGVYFSIVLTLTGDFTGCRWKVYVRFHSAGVDPTGSGLFVCDSGEGISEAIYYSAYLTGTDQCNTVPVTLTKDSETAACPCSGSLPATITLGAA